MGACGPWCELGSPSGYRPAVKACAQRSAPAMPSWWESRKPALLLRTKSPFTNTVANCTPTASWAGPGTPRVDRRWVFGVTPATDRIRRLRPKP